MEYALGHAALKLGLNGPTTASLAYQATAADVKAALLALNLPGVTNIVVAASGSAYTIGFIGSPSIQTADLGLIANGSALVSDNSGTRASITVAASATGTPLSVTPPGSSAGMWTVAVAPGGTVT